MAAPSRRQRRSVEDDLFESGHRFNFFQAVALLELLRPNATPVGEATDAHAEPVAFEGNFGFEFPPSDVLSIQSGQRNLPEDALVLPGKARQPRLRTAILGLGGVLGPLPNAVSELVLERVRRRDTGFRAFLDIFNHRLLSLFYRVRRRARVSLGYEAPPRSPYARYLLSLIGLGTPHLQHRLEMADRSLFLHAGLLAGKGRSAHGLEAMLRHHFRLPIRIVPFHGGWFDLDASEVTRIGQANNALGVNMVLGARVWDQQSGFTVEVDFTDMAQFREFLPVGIAYKRLMALVRFYVGAEYEISLKLRFLPPEVPARGLSAKDGMMLGWTSWIGTHAEGVRIVTIDTRNGSIINGDKGTQHVD
jgi:type VI secretion system protein ImpH